MILLHKKFTGVSNQQIISNLLKLTEMGNKVRLRIPLIPDFTDTEKNLNELIEFIYKLNNVNGIDLLPYNILAESKYKRLNKESEIKNITVQSDDRLNEIKELFQPFDFEVKLRG
jgi:pyruvate formate lyase activating enzyme